MNKSVGKKLNNAMKIMFQKRVLLVAMILLALFFCGYYFLKNQSGYTFKDGQIICKDAAEVAVMSDGATVVGDGSKNVFCISDKGELRYKITMSGDNEISGITLDSKDNLYAYVSIEDKGGANIIRDEIWKFNSKGKEVKKLMTLDYSSENEAGEVSVRTSPLRYMNGYLCFSKFRAMYTDIYRINLSTGKHQRMYSIKNYADFGYTDVEPNSDGSYYYIKATGEIGIGEPGGREKVLCNTTYDIKGLKGIRPFYVRNVGEKIYIMDYWSSYIYKVESGKLAYTSFKKSEEVDLNNMNSYTTELNTCGGRLCGITDGVPWTVDGSRIKTLQYKADVSFVQVAASRTGALMQRIGLPFMVLDAIFIILGLIWMVIRYGRHFLWKLMASFLLIFVIFMISSYFVFSNEQKVYVKTYLADQKHQVELAANTLSGEDVKTLKASGDLSGAVYNRINRMLVSDFSIYQRDSDTACILFVPDGKGTTNTMVASNRGFGGLLGSNEYYNGIIKATGTKSSYGTLADKNMVSCAPIMDSNGKAVGYLIIYTAIKNINDQFMQLWSIPIVAVSLILILLALFLSSTFVSKSMTRISTTIKGIIGGDYSIRIKDLPNDEIGEVGQCVNTLSQNIETLMAENQRKNIEIQRSQEEVLVSLASITEVKSGQTAGHVKRVGQYVRIMAENMGYSPVEVRYISAASMLHDIGKLITPNEILEKPGKLTDEEFERMKTHTTDGERLLHNGTGQIIKYARIIAMEHHEKWDGSGYPNGICGETIDITARITALADVFDALVSRRSYKSAMTPDEAYDIIVSESGHHFDPKVVDVFKEHFEEFKKVIIDYPDKE